MGGVTVPRTKDVAAARAKVGDDRIRIPNGMILLGVDPGDKHVGVASFAEDALGYPGCEWSKEYDPVEAIDFISRQIAANAVWGIAVERFSLYADKALAQIGSEFHTSEMIGVIKHLVRVNNEWVGLTGDNDDGSPWSPPRIRIWIQGADIKKPIRAQMAARGIDRHSPAKSHAGDAEEHGWYRILRGEDNE